MCDLFDREIQYGSLCNSGVTQGCGLFSPGCLMGFSLEYSECVSVRSVTQKPVINNTDVNLTLMKGLRHPWQPNSANNTLINTPMTNFSFPISQITDSIIQDKEYEVMMQIDCEVTDTRILHIRSSTIPPVLRVNHTNTVYQHSSTTEKTAAPPVGVLMGSA